MSRIGSLRGLPNLNTSTNQNQMVNSDETLTQKRLSDKVFSEQIHLLYTNLFISIPPSLLCATIVFITLYRIPHGSSLVYWYIAMIVVSIIRLLHSGLYVYDHKCTTSRYYSFLMATTIAAALWGFAGYALMPDKYLVEQMVVIVVLAGVTAGSIQSLQASLAACLIYIVLLISPLSIWIFLQNDTAHAILGISMVLYLLFTLSISIRGYRFLKNTLIMKYENIYLTENVSSTNKKLQRTNQELIEKENNLRLIHDNAPIGMAIISLDGKWLNVNNKLCEILGYNKDELEHLTIQEITYPDDMDTDVDNRTKLLAGKLQSYEVEKRYIHKNHNLIWIVTNVSLVRGKEDKPLYYISQLQDINDKKLNEIIMSGLSNMNSMLQLCHNSEEAYPIISHAAQEIFVGLSGGLTIFNKITGEQEVVVRWGNDSLLKSFFRSEDCWAFRAGNVYIANNPNKDSICHHFNSTSLGGYICLPLIVQSQVLGMLNFCAPDGDVITHFQQQIINNFSEIVKLSLANIHLNEALSDQAVHDPLTGLLNRRYLYDCLPQMLQHAIRTKQPLCVCMLDVDFFKRVNDIHGHDAGDEVLKFLATLLKNNLRGSDVACRFGGEEFIVVLIGTDLTHAHTHMERIRNEIKSTQIHAQNHLLPPITISIGIAEVPRHGENVNDILRTADAALYVAKETGRDKTVDALSRSK